MGVFLSSVFKKRTPALPGEPAWSKIPSLITVYAAIGENRQLRIRWHLTTYSPAKWTTFSGVNRSRDSDSDRTTSS
jgi:hypothetical protein